MATKIVIEDHIDPPHKGLTQDDITADDSASNVTTSTRTSKGSQSSLAKTRAKKAALLAKQRRQTERMAIEQQRIQTSAQQQLLQLQ